MIIVLHRSIDFLPNWWTFDSLVDARVAAAQFLRAAAPEFAADARGHLLKAADIYDQFVKSTAICFENKDAFLGPWTGKSLADWTPENRAREVAILTSARTLDEQAIAEIDAAVNIEDGR